MPRLCDNCKKEESTIEYKGYECCERCYIQAQLPFWARD